MAVASQLPDKLLGVREGFRRYFHDGLERPLPVAVTPHPVDEDGAPLPLSDDAILEMARDRARSLAAEVGDRFHFTVGSEAGLLGFEAAGERRSFVRCWTVIVGLDGETWGSSGSVQLPPRLVDGVGDEELPYAIPGTRRSGGMAASLTGGLEDRRSTTALATLNALSTLLYGVLQSRPVRRRP